jgi:hypothetical protein
MTRLAWGAVAAILIALGVWAYAITLFVPPFLAGQAPAPAVFVPAAFCPAGMHVVPAPYLAAEPSNAPLCEGGSK